MAYPITDTERAVLRKECVKSILIGSIPPAVGMGIFFSGFPLPLWGTDNFAETLFKNSMGMGTVMTLLMSLGVRSGVRKGSVPVLGWTRTAQPLLKLIPRNVILRALLFGLCAAGMIGSLSLGVALLFGGSPIDRFPFMLFMAGQCACIALCLTPFIMIGAMTDPVKSAKRKASNA